jgi:hypothetical protein
MSATVQHLVTVRSSLAEAIECHDRPLITKADHTPWYRAGKRIRASAVAVPARMLKEEMRPRRDREIEESRQLTGIDPNIATLYERPSDDKEDSPWDQEWVVLRRAMILGAPGGPAAARADVVDWLMEHLRHWNPTERSRAAEALGRLMGTGARFFRAEQGLTVEWVKDLSQYENAV